MNSNIKIILLTFVVLVIAVPTYLFFSGIDPSSEERITRQNFEEIIKVKVDSELSKQPLKIAVTSFHDIWGKIQTEEFITTSEGKKVISEDEVDICRELTYNEYAPIFTKYVLDSAFTKSAWNESDLNYFKNHSQYLESIFCGKNQAIKNDLTKIKDVVSDYYSALALIKRSNNCSTIQSVKDVRTDVQKYQKDPLTNNIQLSGALSQAFENAKKSLADNIKKRGNNLIRNYQGFTDYPQFDQARSDIENLIDGYKKNFNTDSPFSTLKQELFNIDQEAMQYYSNRNTSNSSVNVNPVPSSSSHG